MSLLVMIGEHGTLPCAIAVDDLLHGALGNPSAQDRVELDSLDRFELRARRFPFRIRRIEPDHAQHPSDTRRRSRPSRPIRHWPGTSRAAGSPARDFRSARARCRSESIRPSCRPASCESPRTARRRSPALAGRARVGQPRQRRPHREQRRQVVAGPRRGARRRSRIGKAGLVHRAADRLPDDVVRRAMDVVGVAGLPESRNVRDDQLRIDLPYRWRRRGSIRDRCRASSFPSRCRRARSASGKFRGRAASTDRARRKIRCGAPGSRWSRPPTCRLWSSSLMPIVRQPTSPIPGRSIWITSAPISAASSAANGCAINVPVETILTPCSGPNFSG